MPRAADAAPFVATFSRDLRALAATDLEAAAAEHQRMAASLQLLLELPTADQARHLSQLHKLVVTLVEQVRGAVKALEEVPKDLSASEKEQALHSSRVRDLLRELAELRKLGCALAASREWHGSIFAASASAALSGLVPAADVRAELTQLLQRAAVLAMQEAPEDDEPDEAITRFWALRLPMAQRCSLSLLPLRSTEFSELPATVEWEEVVPCAARQPVGTLRQQDATMSTGGVGWAGEKRGDGATSRGREAMVRRA